MKTNRAKFALCTLALAAAPTAFAVTDTATTALGVTVAAEASITVTASPTLSKGGTEFESFTGNTTFTYRVRTTESTGAGTVTAQVTTPFDSSASGIATADLSHTASTTGVGTANTSSTTASASSATNIISFGAGIHSSDNDSDTGTISWTLADRPAFKTGTHSATVTLTISAS